MSWSPLPAAGEALPTLELLVGLAGEGGELALRGDGVCEELVGPPVVTQVPVALILGAVGCNEDLVNKALIDDPRVLFVVYAHNR